MKFKLLTSLHDTNCPGQAHRNKEQVNKWPRSQAKAFFITGIRHRLCKSTENQGGTTLKNRGIIFPGLNKNVM